jgi:hypothetical protein
MAPYVYAPREDSDDVAACRRWAEEGLLQRNVRRGARRRRARGRSPEPASATTLMDAIPGASMLCPRSSRSTCLARVHHVGYVRHALCAAQDIKVERPELA